MNVKDQVQLQNEEIDQNMLLLQLIHPLLSVILVT